MLSFFAKTSPLPINNLFSCSGPPGYFLIFYCVFLYHYLVFSIAAHMVLCWRFLTKTVLVTHWPSSFCWTVFAQHQDPHSALPGESVGERARGCEGTQRGCSGLTKEIFPTIQCHAQQQQGKEGVLGAYPSFPQELTSHGRWWVIAFASLVLFCSILFLPLILHLLNNYYVFFCLFYNVPQSFLVLFFLSSSPCPTVGEGGKWASDCVVFIHNINVFTRHFFLFRMNNLNCIYTEVFVWNEYSWIYWADRRAQGVADQVFWEQVRSTAQELQKRCSVPLCACGPPPKVSNKNWLIAIAVCHQQTAF